MRWANESIRPIVIPLLHAMEIITDAYYEGYIKWNVYKKVLERIKINMNSSWMFEKNKENRHGIK